MRLETGKDFKDFQLLDTGDGFRLERWGEAILARPDPQIIWPRSENQAEWTKAWAVFQTGNNEEKGKWEIRRAMPDPWIISWTEVKFLLKLSLFKHTGLFAEQTAQWEWMENRLKTKDLKLKNADLGLKPKILNLFAYTGGATMALAKAGCQVTHVDASKPAVTWANENHKLNNLPEDSVRWILDDAAKFVKRELRRGATYDGVIMDPPAFGHSPTGKTWKFNNDLPGLLADCVKLLSDKAEFLVINAYATNSSALALNNILEDNIKRGGKIEFGELCLKQNSGHAAASRVGAGRLISTGIFARWSR